MADLVRCSCTRFNDPWRRFCGGCGSQLAPACRCGFVNSRHDRFCGGCGHRFKTLSWTPSPSGIGTIDTVRAKPPLPRKDHLGSGTERTQRSEPTTIPIEILDDIS